MKKKTEAQIYLEQVEMLDTLIENKLIEQKQWKDIAYSIAANMEGERVQTSGAKSKMADAIDKCVDMESEIADTVDKLIAKKQKVVRTIEKLYSPMEYRILHMRYIQHIRLIDISIELNREYSWVTTTHGRALKNVQKLLERK